MVLKSGHGFTDLYRTVKVTTWGSQTRESRCGNTQARHANQRKPIWKHTGNGGGTKTTEYKCKQGKTKKKYCSHAINTSNLLCPAGAYARNDTIPQEQRTTTRNKGICTRVTADIALLMKAADRAMSHMNEGNTEQMKNALRGQSVIGHEMHPRQCCKSGSLYAMLLSKCSPYTGKRNHHANLCFVSLMNRSEFRASPEHHMAAYAGPQLCSACQQGLG